MGLPFEEYKTEAQKFLEFAKGIERSSKGNDVEIKDNVLKSTTEKGRYSGQAGKERADTKVDNAQENNDSRYSLNLNNIQYQGTEPLENEGRIRVEAGPDPPTRQENKRENPLPSCVDRKVAEREPQISLSNLASSSNGDGRTHDSYDPSSSTTTSTARTYERNDNPEVDDPRIGSSDSHLELGNQTNVRPSVSGSTGQAHPSKTTSVPWNGKRHPHTNFYPSGTPQFYQQTTSNPPQEGSGSSGRMTVNRKFNRGDMNEKNLVESAQRSTSLVKTLLGEHSNLPSVVPNSIPYSEAYPGDARNPPPSYHTYSRYQKRELLQPGTSIMPQDTNIQGCLRVPDNYDNYMLPLNGRSSSYPPINYPLSSNGHSYTTPPFIGSAQYNGGLQTETSTTPQPSYANFTNKHGNTLPVPTTQNRNLPDLQPYNQDSSYDKCRSKRWKKPINSQDKIESPNRASKVTMASKGLKKKPKTLKRMDSIAKKYNLKP